VATRFRLPSTGTAAISPATQSYTHSGTTRRPLRVAGVNSDSSALSTDAVTPDGADDLTAGDTHHVQFISDPLKAQTFTSGDAFKFAIQGLEAHAGNNLQIQVWMGIVNAAGSAVGTIRSKVLEGTELATALTNRFFSGTLSGTVACSDNDRLVIEFSVSGTPTAAGGVQGHNASLRWGSAGGSGDLAENDTETGTGFNPWIEFTTDVAFMPQPPAPLTQRVLPRNVLPVALLAACSFVPVVAAASTADAGASSDTGGLAAARVIQYSALHAPMAIPTVAIPAQWWPVYPDRVPAKPRPVGVGQFRFEQPMPGTLPAADAGPSGDTGGLVAAKLLQYQALAAPVVVAVSETVTLDKWYRPDTIPARIGPRLVPVGRVVAPLHVPDVTDAVTPLSWRATYPARVLGRTVPTAHHAPWFSDRFEAPTPPVQADAAASSDASAIRAHVRVQYQALSAPVRHIVVGGETITLDKWSQNYPVVHPRPRYPRAIYTWAQPMFGVVVEVPVQSWLGNTLFADQTRRLRSHVSRQPASFSDRFDAPTPPVLPDLSWKPNHPDTVRAKSGLRVAAQQAWVADRYQAPDAVTVPALTPPVYPAIVRGHRPRLEGLRVVPAFVPDVTNPVTARSWAPSYPDRIFPARVLHASLQRAYQADRFDEPGVVIVPALSWSPEYADRVLGHRPRLHGLSVVPLYVPDVTVLAPALSWKPTYQDWIARRLAQPWLYPWLLWGIESPEPSAEPDITVLARPIIRIVLARPSVRTVTANSIDDEVER
jgi:hypothetical protein